MKVSKNCVHNRISFIPVPTQSSRLVLCGGRVNIHCFKHILKFHESTSYYNLTEVILECYDSLIWMYAEESMSVISLHCDLS